MTPPTETDLRRLEDVYDIGLRAAKRGDVDITMLSLMATWIPVLIGEIRRLRGTETPDNVVDFRGGHSDGK